jgi:S-adenosylmethionine decarboxylase
MTRFRGGKEWLVDAYRCAPDGLRDAGLFEALFEAVVADLQLTRAAPAVLRKFDGPGGLTMLLPLMESHLTVHTYPEYGLATINLYCCADRAPWPWQAQLQNRLHAATVDVRCIARGRQPL